MEAVKEKGYCLIVSNLNRTGDLQIVEGSGRRGLKVMGRDMTGNKGREIKESKAMLACYGSPLLLCLPACTPIVSEVWPQNLSSQALT